MSKQATWWFNIPKPGPILKILVLLKVFPTQAGSL